MPYVGGKSQAGVYQWIINLIPPHEVFIEPFCGSAAITRKKKPARETILVDKALMPPAAVAELAAVPGVRYVRGCGIEFISKYPWTGREFVYADPPYLKGTRKFRSHYEHEMTNADHRRFLARVVELPCRVMISGYPSALYDDALKGWTSETRVVMTRAHTEATEKIWFNYPRPTILHDFATLGGNKRDRLRIKRKVARWSARLARQDPQERAALFFSLVSAIGITEARAAVDMLEQDQAAAAAVTTGAGSLMRVLTWCADPAPVTEKK